MTEEVGMVICKGKASDTHFTTAWSERETFWNGFLKISSLDTSKTIADLTIFLHQKCILLKKCFIRRGR
jgi:hypothetical protein